MSPWVKAVITQLTPLQDSENAKAMKAYMRDKFEFLGIQSTPRREALKPLFTGKELPQSSAIATIVDELWSLPEREYQLVAIDLLIKRKKHLSADILPKLEEWITTKSWWDTVDMLATNVVATVYLNHPQQTSTYIQKWRNSEDICYAEPRSCTSLSSSKRQTLSICLSSSKKTKPITNSSFKRPLGGRFANTPKPMQIV